jgi:hypothetical protein
MGESTTTRKAGGLSSRPEVWKTKARQCFKRCGCNRVHSIQFENNHLIHQPNRLNHAGAKGRADNYYQKEDCYAILNLYQYNTWIIPVFLYRSDQKLYLSI